MPRHAFLVQQGDYFSLKWAAANRPNAGAISFEQKNFKGCCYVNSKEVYARGHDRTLAEEMAEQGFNFQADGFHPAHFAADGSRRVKGLGSGSRYLGYRTFGDLGGAIAYLNSNGIKV